MSSGGRWRLLAALVRATAVMTTVAACGWGGWMVFRALHANPAMMPAAARAVPIAKFELRTSADGVLDRDPQWLTRTLALPPRTSLMEIDLQDIRERLLADPQVLTANVVRRFPATLVVSVTERTPLARVMAATETGPRQFLVGQDGMVFAGSGFSAETLATLPWLDGVALARQDRRFLPVDGMDRVRELITTARMNVEYIYATWHVISLERLASDREIIVRTRQPVPMTIIFRADERQDRVRRELAFFDQIVKLNYLWASLVDRPAEHVRVDLSLGRQVPVKKTFPVAADTPASRPATALIALPASQPWKPREL